MCLWFLIIYTVFNFSLDDQYDGVVNLPHHSDLYQCYKYRVGEYIAEGPKNNYQIYWWKCQQTSAIYWQNKKYKNIKKYKNSKNYYIFEKIAKYRDQIGKKLPKNRGKYRGDILSIYHHWVNTAINRDVADIAMVSVTLILWHNVL